MARAAQDRLFWRCGIEEMARNHDRLICQEEEEDEKEEEDEAEGGEESRKG